MKLLETKAILEDMLSDAQRTSEIYISVKRREAIKRSIWYQKNNPFVVYFDKRKGKFLSQSGDKVKQDVIKGAKRCNTKYKKQESIEMI